MFTHTSNRRAWKIASRVVGALALISGAAGAASTGWQTVVSPELLRIYEQGSTAELSTGTIGVKSTARFDVSGRVQVDIHFDCSTTAPAQQLATAGLRINVAVRRPPLCVVEGWAAAAALPRLATVSNVKLVKLPAYALKRPRRGSIQALRQELRQSVPQTSGTPVIDGNAVTIMHADVFASQTGIAGAGVTVGVLSDDVTSLAVIQSRGELPAVQVLTIPGEAANSNPTDEGTMMLEEVHAVAPAADLAFCGPETSTEYVSCLGQLVAAGASIVVDDLAWGDEDLLSSNSTFVQGVESFLSQNPKALLFTVTENYNGSYWQGNYQPVALSTLGVGSSATCNGNGQTDFFVNNFVSPSGSASFETLTVHADGTYLATFQWSDPFGQNASDFDVYWLDTSNGTILCVGAAGSTNTFFGPEVPLSAGTYNIVIATPDQGLAGKFMKLWFGGDGLTALSSSTPGSIISPQAFAAGAITIGAVNAADGIGDTIESFSGQGPIDLVFPSSTSIAAPTLVGLDAVYVDAAGTDFQVASDGLFYGTSAASPNAAAVAALIRSAFPTLTRAQLTSALESGANRLGTGVPNSVYGYGRVDALSALASVQVPTLSGFTSATIVGGTSSVPSALAVTGVGNLKFTVTSSSSSLIPASLVSAGAPGVTIAPSTCGTSTTSCTVSITPTIGQIGSSTIAITVADAAKRTASVTATMTVTKPALPSITVTGGGSQSITNGSSASSISITLAGTGSLSVTASSSNTSLLPNASIVLSSGCGTATLKCTLTPTVAAGQTGASTVTIAVKDPYGQTATAMATLQVSAQSSSGGGGGGSVDIETLLLLSSLLILRAARYRLSGRDPRATLCCDVPR
jgi:hypothetical protein